MSKKKSADIFNKNDMLPKIKDLNDLPDEEKIKVLKELDDLPDEDENDLNDVETMDDFAENFLSHKVNFKGETVSVPVKPYIIFPSGFNKLIKVSANKKNYVVYEFYFNDVANLTRAVGTVLKIYIPSWLCFNLKNGGWCIGVDAINFNADLINYLDELSKKRADRVKLVF